MKNKQGFFYGSAVLMVSMAAVKLLGALFKIPLAALLRETGMGYFTSAYTVYTLIYSLAVSGLSAAEARMTSLYRSKGKATAPILRASMLLFVLLGVFATLAALLLARSFSQWMNSPESFLSIVALAPAILFCCIMAAFRGYYEGCSDMRPTAAVQVAEAAVKAAAGLLFAFVALQHGMNQYESGSAVYGVICASRDAAVQASIPFASAFAMLGVTLSTAVGALVLFFYHSRKPKQPSQTVPYRPICKELLKTAAPITLSSLVMQLAAMIDTVTVRSQLACGLSGGISDAEQYRSFLSPGEPLEGFLYGCFMSCMTLFHIVPAFCAVFGKSALPLITSVWTAGDREVFSQKLASVFRVSILLAAPMSFGMAAISRSILQVLYPTLPGMAAVGETFLPILAAASFFFALLSPFQAVMQGIGRSDILLRGVFFGTVIKLVLNLALIRIPPLHIKGAAIATLVCYAFIAGYLTVWLKRNLPLRLSVGRMIAKPILSAFLSAFSAFFMQKYLTNHVPNSIIAFVSFVTGIVVYVAALLALRVIRRSDFSFVQK